MRTLRIAVLYTLATAVLLGLGYPLAVTGIAHLAFPRQASGELIVQNGRTVGSKLIGQTFTGPEWFDSRPSAAGTGYDASSSGGSNLASTSKALVDRVNQSVGAESVNGTPVPVDLVTASGSGLDPDITPAAAYYQIPRIADARHLSAAALHSLVAGHITPRQLGLLGEDRVNVLELNLALEQMH